MSDRIKKPKNAAMVDLQLTPGSVESAVHGHLISFIQTGKIPNLRAVVTIGDMSYVALPAPAGFDPDVYALRPLRDEPCGKPSDDDQYEGAKVCMKPNFFFISPRSAVIYVRDPGAAQAEGNEPPAEVTSKTTSTVEDSN